VSRARALPALAGRDGGAAGSSPMEEKGAGDRPQGMGQRQLPLCGRGLAPKSPNRRAYTGFLKGSQWAWVAGTCHPSPACY